MPIGTTAAIIGGSILAGGSVASSWIGSSAANKAVGAQTDAAAYAAELERQSAQEAIALQREMWQAGERRLEPYDAIGRSAAMELSRLMGFGPLFPTEPPAPRHGHRTGSTETRQIEEATTGLETRQRELESLQQRRTALQQHAEELQRQRESMVSQGGALPNTGGYNRPPISGFPVDPFNPNVLIGMREGVNGPRTLEEEIFGIQPWEGSTTRSSELAGIMSGVATPPYSPATLTGTVDISSIDAEIERVNAEMNALNSELQSLTTGTANYPGRERIPIGSVPGPGSIGTRTIDLGNVMQGTAIGYQPPGTPGSNTVDVRFVGGHETGGLEPYEPPINLVRGNDGAYQLPENYLMMPATELMRENWQTDPGYQFRIDEIQKAIERSAAARGGLKSGRTMKELNRVIQGVASDEYSRVYGRTAGEQADIYNRLAGLFGTGQQTSQAALTSGQNYASNVGNILMSSSRTQGDLATQAANARASGYIAGANTWGNTIGNIAQLPMQYLTIRQLMRGA